MKLTVLVDNNTYIDQYYLGEPALSFYIEDGDYRALFDTGYSDALIKNAKALELDLTAISSIILSHGHDDHTKGLVSLFNAYDLRHVNIIAHPNVFKERREGDRAIGCPFSGEEIKKYAKLCLSSKPVKLNEHITFLGEIPTSYPFEVRKPFGFIKEDKEEQVDFIADDTAIVYQNEKGIFIITGCSHSGICNIIEYAKQICNEQNILGVIGGFHLFDVSEQLKETVRYFRKNHIQELYPCHCVSFNAKAEIHKAMPIHEVGVGLRIEID